MTQLNDVFADIPIQDRKKLFEAHIKPFGANVHHKMHIGKKYEFKVDKNPHALAYKPVNKPYKPGEPDCDVLLYSNRLRGVMKPRVQAREIKEE